MIKLAVIGASYLQEPLIRKAKERGFETHVLQKTNSKKCNKSELVEKQIMYTLL